MFHILFIITFIHVTSSAATTKNGCLLSINDHLTDPQPLLLLQSGAVNANEAFPHPIDKEGTLVFEKGQTIDIACPDGEVEIDEKATGKSVLEAKCVSGIKFKVENTDVPFTSITCTKVPDHVARYTNNKCGKTFKEIEIGFEINDRFIRHITTCFDDVLQNVLYAQSEITPMTGGSQVNYPRPAFQMGKFYHVKPNNVNDLYSQNGQREMINEILGRESSDTSIIQPNSNFYLATGHYAPKADFVFGAQQRLTFYYVNAAPQWQTFNGGNWNTMEGNYRDLAYERSINLVVYTGSFGLSTLPDVNGNEVELYLWKSDDQKVGIPVPKFFYKVLYDPASKAGIALVGHNNPYRKVAEDEIICKNVCQKVSWLTWKNTNVTLGYSYCCTVADFRKTVTVLPKFVVKKLLV